MPLTTTPIDAPILPARQRRSRREPSSSRGPACTHSTPVLSAALNPGAPVAVFAQFRSVALAGADRIASARIAVRMCAVCAPFRGVFEDVQLMCGRSLHAPEFGIGASHEAGILTQENGNV